MNKKVKWLYVLVPLCLMVSCQQKDKKVYDLPIERPDLVRIMMDLSIAEAAATQIHGVEKDSIKNVYKLYIEEIHGYPISYIDSILGLLYLNYELNKEMQSEVLDSLKVLEIESKTFIK